MRACLAPRHRQYKGKMGSSWHLPALPLYKPIPAKTDMDTNTEIPGNTPPGELSAH